MFGSLTFFFYFKGEYEDTFATIRQVVVQKSIIKRMLENGGAVEDSPYFMSEGDLTERVNHLVGVFVLCQMDCNDQT